MRRGPILFAAVIAAMFLFLLGKGVLVEPPAVREATPGHFDTARAYGRLERILAGMGPHIGDSPANDVVRERIVAELRAIGLQPRVTDQMTCNGFTRSHSVVCGRVRNIVVTLGPAEGRHLLLVSHYDSATAGPGASDDGIGVASMLEIAAQLHDQPLRRPVTLLFNEGEESGLNGARAFLDSDPAAPAVDTVINLEARGVSGPAIMFETSQPNGTALAALAEGSSTPFANSLSTDFYRLLPNSTDVTVFEERPWTILNFAILGNETRYHTAGDDLASLDRRSLQHMGTEALGLTRAITSGDLDQSGASLVYADFYGLGLITLSVTLAFGLFGLALVVLAVTVWKRQALGRALLAVTVAVLLATLLGFLVNFVTGWLRPGDYWRGYPLVTFAGFYAVAFAGGLVGLLTIGSRIERSRLRSAFWLLFVIVGSILCLVAPGAVIYFLFPPLIAAVSAIIGRQSRVSRVLDVVAALLLLVTFAEPLAMVELTLIDGPYWILAPLGVLAILPLLIEAKPAEADVPRGFVLWPAAGLAVALWAAMLLVPRATEDRQQLFTIEYVRDLANNESYWAVSNKSVGLPDGWAGFQGWRLNDIPYSSRRRWTADTPPLDVPQPRAEIIAQRVRADGNRQVRLRLRPSGAESILIRFPASAGLRLAGAGTDMRQVDPGTGDTMSSIRCQGRGCDGLEVDLVLANRPVEGQILTNLFRLPPQAQPLLAARPANACPQYGPDSTYVIAPLRF